MTTLRYILRRRDGSALQVPTVAHKLRWGKESDAPLWLPSRTAAERVRLMLCHNAKVVEQELIEEAA